MTTVRIDPVTRIEGHLDIEASVEYVDGTQQVIEAKTDQQWVDGICDLFQNPDVAARLGKAGRQYVEQNHRWNDCLQPFADLLQMAS